MARTLHGTQAGHDATFPEPLQAAYGWHEMILHNNMIKKYAITIAAAFIAVAFQIVSAQPKSDFIAGEKASQERIRVASDGLANPERGFRFEIKIGVENAPATESLWPFPEYRDDGIVMTQYCGESCRPGCAGYEACGILQ